MNHTTTVLFLFCGCSQVNDNANSSVDSPTELYNTFDQHAHLLPDFNKVEFDTLHGWDFGWAILQPINIASDKLPESSLSKRLSPGQKALYFFWYLDAEVTNGGFIQFYFNDYRKYLPPIVDGLELIRETKLLDLVSRADQLYLANKDKFDLQREKNDWEPLYNDLSEFEKLNHQYNEIRDQTMNQFEQYVRQNPNDFVKLK